MKSQYARESHAESGEPGTGRGAACSWGRCPVRGACGLVRDGMKDYEIDELAARHLVGELVELPQFGSEREVEDWFLERGFKVEWI